MNKIRSSRCIGPDDLRQGDYVTVASVMFELIPFLLDDSSWKQDLEPSRVSVMPDCAGYPLKIGRGLLAVCIGQDTVWRARNA